jgi:hypothetical protein
MITKNISIGSLDIDPEGGRIWLNCPNCLLRIQNLRFNKFEEKFSMIEINGNDVWMMPGNLADEPYSDFLEKITSYIIPKMYELCGDDNEKLLDVLSLKIKEELDNYASIK